MAKTDDTFLSMMRSSAVPEVKQDDKKSEPRDVNPEALAMTETLPKPDPSIPTPEKKKIGRPSSFEPGEPVIRRNYRISEVDDQALRIYIGTTEEKDLSQIVRNAIRAYIPENIYRTAEVMVNLKHSTVG